MANGSHENLPGAGLCKVQRVEEREGGEKGGREEEWDGEGRENMEQHFWLRYGSTPYWHVFPALA